MKNLDSNQGKVSFQNNPKLSEYAIDAKKNELRETLIPLVENFIATNPLFKGKDASVTFSHNGVASLVCIVNTLEGKFVLKISLKSYASHGESSFLKVWEDAGVRTPHVLEEGKIGPHDYLLMEYIDAPLLADAYSKEELIEKEIYFKMGATLRTMHEPAAEGFGFVAEGKGKFPSFEAWVDSSIKEKSAYVTENAILTQEHGSLDKAVAILTEHINKNTRTSYCHSDFTTGNIFATEPMTVFDPRSNFNNGYIDLAGSMSKLIGSGVPPQQLIDGYFQNEAYSKRVLHAAVFVVMYLKIWHLYKKDRTSGVENWRAYLIQNKHLLEE